MYVSSVTGGHTTGWAGEAGARHACCTSIHHVCMLHEPARGMVNGHALRMNGTCKGAHQVVDDPEEGECECDEPHEHACSARSGAGGCNAALRRQLVACLSAIVEPVAAGFATWHHQGGCGRASFGKVMTAGWAAGCPAPSMRLSARGSAAAGSGGAAALGDLRSSPTGMRDRTRQRVARSCVRTSFSHMTHTCG